jgi:serine/threonine-protein kinase
VDPTRWKRIADRLDELLDLGPAERSARLAALPPEDADLREELERILAADSEDRPGVLDQEVQELAEPLFDSDEAPGTPDGHRIGPYRVIGRLGRGGMGEVLLAERADGDFEQRVALKVVPGDGLRPDHAERLRQERQIPARLRHPNIAALYDGGVMETGAPYFAMEVVEGVPIDEYCTAQDLSENDRVLLFDAVCRAVHYAHRNLVIRRDIKPSNVMVTNDGTVKLLDFGIAKLVDVGDATRTQHRFLTPAFAAPEQLRGEPTSTATDIYALGALLHELVAGHRPDRDTAVELKRRSRGDLDLILDKALREDPDDRYATAEELRLELERHRESLPVSARPPSTSYKLKKFVRRNRLAVAAASTAIAAVLGFSVWISVLYARSEAHRARAVEAEASTAREAETLRRVTEFLTELFERASPAVSHGEDVTARDLLDAGAARIDEELDTEPDVRATLQLTMAASYRWLGRYEEALQLAESAAGNRRQAFGDGSAGLAEAQAEIGWLQVRLGRYDEAEATNRDVVRTLEAAHGPDHPDVAEGWSALGATLFEAGRFGESEAAMRKALEIHERAAVPDPRAIALASSDLGATMLATGRYDEAGELFAHAIDAHTAAGDTTHPALATYLSNLCDVRRGQGRLEEAEALGLRALDVAIRTMGEDNVEVAERHNSVGLLYHQLGRYDEAERHFLRSIELFRANLGDDHPKVVWAMDNLAAAYVDAGRLDDADALCEEVVRQSAISVGEESVYHGVVRLTMATLREAQGRWLEGGDLREQALPLYEAEFGRDHPTVANRLRPLAENRRRLGRPDEAEAHLRRALAIYEETRGADSAEARDTRARLAALGDQ